MWIDEAVLYQIYPLGFCGAPGRTTEFPRTGWTKCGTGFRI